MATLSSGTLDLLRAPKAYLIVTADSVDDDGGVSIKNIEAGRFRSDLSFLN